VQLVAAGGKAELPQRDLRVDARLAGLGRDRADELDLRAGRDVQADLGQRRLRVLGEALREVLARPGRDKSPGVRVNEFGPLLRVHGHRF